MPFEIISPSDQVANHLRKELFKDRWRNEFPGTPALATELGIDRKTIMAALKTLENEGLLVSQGAGRPRKIALPEKRPSNVFNIQILPYEKSDQQLPFFVKLKHQLQQAGHTVGIANKTLPGLGMDVARVSNFVNKHPADLWIPVCGTRSILEWFADQATPAFAIFGRRRDVALGSIGPDKIPAMTDAVRRLVELGHRRIVYLVRKERREPIPGKLERHFLAELESHGIATSRYNMPAWDENPKSYNACLDKLLRHTPPTALLIDEPPFYVATTQHLARRGIASPRDISLICVDSDPIFDWCDPVISHIHWTSETIIKQTLQWVRQLSHGKNLRKPMFTEAAFVEGGTIGPARKDS